MTATGLVKVAAWVGGVGFAFTLSSVLATSLGQLTGEVLGFTKGMSKLLQRNRAVDEALAYVEKPET